MASQNRWLRGRLGGGGVGVPGDAMGRDHGARAVCGAQGTMPGWDGGGARHGIMPPWWRALAGWYGGKLRAKENRPKVSQGAASW